MTRILLRFFICWVFGGVAVNMVAPHWLWAEQVVQAVVDRGSTGNSIPVQIKNISRKEPIKNILMELMEHSPSLMVTKVTPEILADIPPGGTGSFDVQFNVSEEAIPGDITQITFLLLARQGHFEMPNPVVRIQIKPEEEEAVPPPPPEVEPGPGGLPIFVLSEITHQKSFRYGQYEMEWDGKSTGHVERWRTKKGQKALTDIRTSVITQYPRKIVLGKPFSFTAQAQTRHYNLQHCWGRNQKHKEIFAFLGLRSTISTVDVKGQKDLAIFCDEAGVFKTGRDGRQHRTSVRSIHKDGQVQATLTFVPTKIIRDKQNRPIEFYYQPQLSTSGESNEYSGLKERRFYSLDYRGKREKLVIDSAGYFNQTDWIDSISVGIIDLGLKYLPATRSVESLSPPQFKGPEDLSDFSPGEETGESPAPGEVAAQGGDRPAPGPEEEQPSERDTPPAPETVFQPAQIPSPPTGETIPEQRTRPTPPSEATGETGPLVEEHLPPEETHFDLIGSWKFGRVNGPFLCDITLTAEKGAFGNVIKACHPNESFWAMENGELVFRHRTGTVMSRLRKENENHWTGPYVPDRRITHYITRDKEPSLPVLPTTQESNDCGNLSGAWLQSSGNSGSSTWHLTQRGDGLYNAKEQGLGNAVGTAVYNGTALKIEWKTGDWSGLYEWTLEPNCSRGMGRLVFKTGGRAGQIDSSSVERQTSEERESDQRMREGMEPGIDRMGSDYKNFGLSSADPSICRDACNKENRCKAWTYVKPGLQGSQARCWLKYEIPPPKANECCVSGVKAEGQPLEEIGADLVGLWKFGRVNGPFLCNITLTAEKGAFGNVIKACHPNESFWAMENGELVFRHTTGTAMSRLRKENENYWTGPYVPDRRITHYITRDKEP